MSLPVSRIILLNGASSAGKSTLCRALQAQLPEPFLYFALDLLLFSKEVVPQRPGVVAFEWSRQRPRLFGGYHRSLAAFASAGNNLIVDYVLETQETLSDLVRLLAPFDVFFVGVHCPLPELERRERARGDRRIGDARMDFGRVHTFSGYDFELDSLGAQEENAARVVAAWQNRTRPGVFNQLGGERLGGR
ncbi:chloramphenicol phosphotransferase CPT family protein [Deinococcus rubellus]|uniref:Chloramphenicol phosphotransferase CPT family protein n=1 Tax=Deinococcus rubellus TaxID=1889240 RepID=A0ABY5YHU2_9DEIO|nr:chloramphenicol phosphotransferase CPT family protein [Deinococcus rubellus]UWX64496.1 chloramphenicol phosphotransferase CPT family protein [Deinococcus rubellus]